jgi:hypothetical protein
MIANLVQDAAHHRTLLLLGCLVAAAVLFALLARPLAGLVRRLPAGTPWFYYLASAGGLAVSLNTSWRFFGDRLGVTGAERVVMFSVVELALIACALGMRANVRRLDPVTGRPGAPGAPRTVAWVLCGLSAYAALLLSGPVDGVARVALGPLLSLVMLHLALGIEIRNHSTARTGTWARVVTELRERVLSRLGLADDDRDALTRTRERAARRVALLALSNRAPLRTARLSRALRASNVAHDDRIQRRMLAELAVLRHAGDLATLELPSPWTVPARPAEQRTERHEPAPPRDVDRRPRPVPERRAPAERQVREDTHTNAMLDSVLLAADTSPEWASEASQEAAIDLADDTLPDRTPREIVSALGQIGITVGESAVRRRRAQRRESGDQVDQLG